MKNQRFKVLRNVVLSNRDFAVGEIYELTENGLIDAEGYNWTEWLEHKGETLLEKWLKYLGCEVNADLKNGCEPDFLCEEIKTEFHVGDIIKFHDNLYKVIRDSKERYTLESAFGDCIINVFKNEMDCEAFAEPTELEVYKAELEILKGEHQSLFTSYSELLNDIKVFEKYF